MDKLIDWALHTHIHVGYDNVPVKVQHVTEYGVLEKSNQFS